MRLDDSLDVFGIHGLGRHRRFDRHGDRRAADPWRPWRRPICAWRQLVRQLGAVLLAIGWSAAGSAPASDLTLRHSLRRDGDEEREGLDLSDHGERAYNP
jgi:Amt family ammonium transporter